MKPNLLISAVGDGSRIAMFTFNNVIPKCLLSVGNQTMLEKIIDNYSGIVDTVYIVCKASHVGMIDNVLSFRKYQNYKLIPIEKPTKSPYESIFQAAKSIDCQTDLFINWSDVTSKIVTVPRKTTIYLDDNYVHRNLGFKNIDGMNYVFKTADKHGNIPGIFFLKGHDFVNLVNSYELCKSIGDIDKVISVKFNDFELEYLSNVTDIGEYEKYTKYLSDKSNIARYFNEIKIEKDYVTKCPIAETGYKLHDIELSFYRSFGDQVQSLCKLIRYDWKTKTMYLEKIKGKTCQSYVDSFDGKQKTSAVNKMLKSFDKAIKQFHDVEVFNKPTESEEFLAAHKEFVDMIRVRVEPCLPMINSVISNLEIDSIDGMPITKNFDELLSMVQKWFDEHESEFEFGICHGDPNTDNSMRQSNGDIRFIDPRGFFGGLNVLGWSCKQYDYAKFAYGFSGYSRFTNTPFIAMRVENRNLSTYIGPSEIEGITDVSIFDMKIDDMTRVLIGIIWVKLTSYIINNPMKSVLAYLYGNALLTKLLGENKE